MQMFLLGLSTLFSMVLFVRRMPGRDWQTEFHARLFKRFFKTAQRKGPQWSREMIAAQTSKSSVMERISVEPFTLADVPGLMITPQSLDPSVKRILVYFHGGGYVTGGAKGYLAFTARLADQSQLLTYCPDYSLSPEHPFPRPQEDCYRVLTAIAVAHPEHQLIVMGDSAGGALAISSVLHGKPETRKRIAGLGLISPWVDPTADSGSIVTNVPNDMFTQEILVESYASHMQGADPLDGRASFVHANLANFPPMLIQVAGGEVFYDQVKDFAQRAQEAGVDCVLEEFPTQFHVFQTLAHGFPEAKQARASLARFAAGSVA